MFYFFYVFVGSSCKITSDWVSDANNWIRMPTLEYISGIFNYYQYKKGNVGIKDEKWK